MRKFRFIKKYESYEGTIPEGSEIAIMEDRNVVYFNGGLVHTAYQNMLRHMISDDKIRNEYLREETIPYNKV